MEHPVLFCEAEANLLPLGSKASSCYTLSFFFHTYQNFIYFNNEEMTKSFSKDVRNWDLFRQQGKKC